MFFTDLQKTILNTTKMSKIIYKEMFKKNHQLGYTSKGDQYGYHISIASDAPSEDVKNIVLIHEAGHIYFRHVDENIKNELSNIEAILISHNKTFEDLNRCYGGPMKFLNICMDLEVNSKLLTFANVSEIKKYFDICLPKNYNVPILNKFFEYYEPLIDKMPHDEEPECLDNGNEDGMDIPDGDSSNSKSGNNSTPNNKDKNSSSNNTDNNFDDEIPNENNSEGEESSFEDYMKDISKKLKDDLGLSDELRDALEEENYIPDNESNQNKNNIEKEISVKEFLKEKNINDIGNDSNSNDLLEVVDNNDKNIGAFLRRILGDNLVIKPDALRHYNRGTRDRSNGLLYNSFRRKTEFNKKRLCIIIDVSGSMNTESITKAIASIKDCYQMLDPESEVYTWDTRLVQSFKLNNIPNQIKHGGGTELASALSYASRKNFTDIIIYSDFETSPSSFNNVRSKLSSNIYPIYVYGYSGKYAKVNKKSFFKDVNKTFPNLFKKNNYLIVS